MSLYSTLAKRHSSGEIVKNCVSMVPSPSWRVVPTPPFSKQTTLSTRIQVVHVYAGIPRKNQRSHCDRRFRTPTATTPPRFRAHGRSSGVRRFHQRRNTPDQLLSTLPTSRNSLRSYNRFRPPPRPQLKGEWSMHSSQSHGNPIYQERPEGAAWTLWRRANKLWSSKNGELTQPLGDWVIPSIHNH